MTTDVIKVKGMTCGHCTSAIEDAFKEFAGIDSVVADLESATATFVHDGSVDIGYIKGLIEEMGFELG